MEAEGTASRRYYTLLGVQCAGWNEISVPKRIYENQNEHEPTYEHNHDIQYHYSMYAVTTVNDEQTLKLKSAESTRQPYECFEGGSWH